MGFLGEILYKKMEDYHKESQNTYNKAPEVEEFEKSPAFEYFFKLYPDKALWDNARASELLLSLSDDGNELQKIKTSNISNSEKIRAEAKFYKNIFEKYNTPHSKANMPNLDITSKQTDNEEDLKRGLNLLKGLCAIRKIEYIRSIASTLVDDETEKIIGKKYLKKEEEKKDNKITKKTEKEKANEKQKEVLNRLKKGSDAVDIKRESIDLNSLSLHKPQKDLGRETCLKISLLNSLSPFFKEEDISIAKSIYDTKCDFERKVEILNKDSTKKVLSVYQKTKSKKELKSDFDKLSEKEQDILISQLNQNSLDTLSSFGKKYQTSIQNVHTSLASALKEKESVNESVRESEK